MFKSRKRLHCLVLQSYSFWGFFPYICTCVVSGTKIYCPISCLSFFNDIITLVTNLSLGFSQHVSIFYLFQCGKCDAMYYTVCGFLSFTPFSMIYLLYCHFIMFIWRSLWQNHFYCSLNFLNVTQISSICNLFVVIPEYFIVLHE